MTGASGLLGNKIAELACRKAHEVYSSYREHRPAHGNPVLLDQTEETQVRKSVSEIQPNIIINAAALTDVDSCEDQPENALLVNATSVAHLANASKESGAFLIQVSTDYVFDGEKGSYLETDKPHPVNKYGLSKLKGEQATMTLEKGGWCIVRASVVYGWGRPQRPNAATYVYSKLSRGERISIVDDQYASPTLNTSLAAMLLEIAERKISGVLHTAGASRLSRYDFALAVARTLELDTRLISSVGSARMSWRAKRPRDSSLNVAKSSRTLSNPPYAIEKALSQFLEEYHIIRPSHGL